MKSIVRWNPSVAFDASPLGFLGLCIDFGIRLLERSLFTLISSSSNAPLGRNLGIRQLFVANGAISACSVWLHRFGLVLAIPYQSCHVVDFVLSYLEHLQKVHIYLTELCCDVCHDPDKIPGPQCSMVKKLCPHLIGVDYLSFLVLERS
jgi:hypothetical protein